MAETPQFNLRDYEESISAAFPPEVIEQLNQMEDFRKAYEGNPELAEIFKEAGISADWVRRTHPRGLADLRPGPEDACRVQGRLRRFP